jgi:hypothetical protein
MFSTYVLTWFAKSVTFRGRRILGFRDEDDDMGNAGWDLQIFSSSCDDLNFLLSSRFYLCLFRGLPNLWDIRELLKGLHLN